MADLSGRELRERSVPTLEEHFLRRGLLYSAATVKAFSGVLFEQAMQISNPGGSGVNAIVFSIKHSVLVAATTSQLNQLWMGVFKNSTITVAGTAVPTANRKTLQTDVSNVTIGLNPTFTGGIALSSCTIINSVQSAGPFVIEPGSNLTMFIASNVAANSDIIEVVWAEDPV